MSQRVDAPTICGPPIDSTRALYAGCLVFVWYHDAEAGEEGWFHAQVVRARSRVCVRYTDSGSYEVLEAEEATDRLRVIRRVRCRSTAHPPARTPHPSRHGRVRQPAVVLDGPRAIQTPAADGGAADEGSGTTTTAIPPAQAARAGSQPRPERRQPLEASKTSAEPRISPSVRVRTSVSAHAPLREDEEVKERASDPLPLGNPPSAIHPTSTRQVATGQRCWVRFDDSSKGHIGWYLGRVEQVSANVLVRFKGGSTEKIFPENFPERLRLLYLTPDEPLGRRSSTQADDTAETIRPEPVPHGRAFSRATFNDTPHSSVACFSRQDQITWDLCSGPWKSYSLSCNRDVDDVIALSVDCEALYRPDVACKLEEWNPWRFMMSNYAVDHGNRILLPYHVHASPPCTTYGFMAWFHRRSRADVVAGEKSSAEAHDADRCLRALSFFISQCRRRSIPTTFSVENPENSLLFRFPDLVRTQMHQVTVDYCCYGSSVMKPTTFALTPVLADRAVQSWAVRCERDNRCGSMRVEGRNPLTLNHGSEANYSDKQSKIPALLCLLLIDNWRQHHLPKRSADDNYCTISMDAARCLSGEWEEAAKKKFM